MKTFPVIARATLVSIAATLLLAGCAAAAPDSEPSTAASDTESSSDSDAGTPPVADDTTGVCVVASPADITELFGSPATSEERMTYIGVQANGEQLVGAMCRWLLDDVQLDLVYIAANEFDSEAVECNPPAADELVDLVGVGSTAWWGRSAPEGEPVRTLQVCTATALVISEITASDTDDAVLQSQAIELVERLFAVE